MSDLGRDFIEDEDEDEEEEERRRHVAEGRARVAESQVASRSFPRLRLNVTHISPGYITCSLFQSDNAGTNWGCVGAGVNFPEEWFKQTFGAAAVGRRIEFTVGHPMEVKD